MDNIRILQLGGTPFDTQFDLPAYCRIIFINDISKPNLSLPDDMVDMAIICKSVNAYERDYVARVTRAHTVFFLNYLKVKKGGNTAWLYRSKCGKTLYMSHMQDFLNTEARNYFPKPYGEKFNPEFLSVAASFEGRVKRNGGYSLTLEGDFGPGLRQAAFWRNNIPIYEGQALDLWLEYKKTGDIEIALEVVLFRNGAVSEVQQVWHFSEQDLEDIVTVDNGGGTGPLFVTVLARGSGRLDLIALHDRYSRRGRGAFLPGGDRYVTSEREEIFCYFDPMDRKPPLNIYFSGYKTMEGFEGYRFIRRLGAPFLLITDARLEGGSFYMGSEEYETLMTEVIRDYMDRLEFGPEDVVMAGLSMGTYGAMYYGCDIRPRLIITGKPLASLGDVAENERVLRPGGFPTSLDLLLRMEGGTDDPAVEALNDRFWTKFDGADWSRTEFISAYMLEDDYDRTAYDTLISHLHDAGVRVCGKGLHGRHNDNTGGIVSWFVSQYERTLKTEFGRDTEKR